MSRDGNREVPLSSPAAAISNRGAFPTLRAQPTSTDQFAGRFELVGLNLFRGGVYFASAEFGIDPHPDTPNAPFVQAPCVVFTDLVDGYGPNYNDGFWTQVGLTLGLIQQLVTEGTLELEPGQTPQNFLDNARRGYQILNTVVNGCAAAVAEFFGSLTQILGLIQELAQDPTGFVNEQLTLIRDAVVEAVDDPANAVDAVLEGVLMLEQLRDDPLTWFGNIGCQLAIEVITASSGLELRQQPRESADR